MNEFSFWVGALLDCMLNSHKNMGDDTGPVIAHPHQGLCHHCSGLVVHIFPARQRKLFVYVYYVWMFFTITGMKFIQFYDWK